MRSFQVYSHDAPPRTVEVITASTDEPSQPAQPTSSLTPDVTRDVIEEVDYDQCEAHLMHCCDADYGDVWQCDLPSTHAGRHHAFGGFTGGGDGFDADCVELHWHADTEAITHPMTH